MEDKPSKQRYIESISIDALYLSCFVHFCLQYVMDGP